jgi:uncharacterized membrane protein YbhN (UPF0104 family)
MTAASPQNDADGARSGRWRTVVRWAGLALSVVALGWICVRFARSGSLELLARLEPTPVLVLAFAVGTSVYFLALVMLAFAWSRMLARFSQRDLPASSAMALYAVSQYGKYLPGNVAHYALRHGWGRRRGLRHESLALAALLEAVLLALVALALAFFADPRSARVLASINLPLAIVCIAGAVTVLVWAIRWARSSPRMKRWEVPHLGAATLLEATVCYAAFFLCGAISLVVLAHALGIGVDGFRTLLAANAASWVAGFIVVGAPAGLGVREVAFVALAGTALGDADALLLAGLFRITTFAGDTLFFAVGSLVARREARRSGERVA